MKVKKDDYLDIIKRCQSRSFEAKDLVTELFKKTMEFLRAQNEAHYP
jgi:hypothetical protein